jgi:hypothetical protein
MRVARRRPAEVGLTTTGSPKLLHLRDRRRRHRAAETPQRRPRLSPMDPPRQWGQAFPPKHQQAGDNRRARPAAEAQLVFRMRRCSPEGAALVACPPPNRTRRRLGGLPSVEPAQVAEGTAERLAIPTPSSAEPRTKSAKSEPTTASATRAAAVRPARVTVRCRPTPVGYSPTLAFRCPSTVAPTLASVCSKKSVKFGRTAKCMPRQRARRSSTSVARCAAFGVRQLKRIGFASKGFS